MGAFLAKAQGLQPASTGHGSDDAEDGEQQQLLQQPFLPLDMLKQLQASLASGKQAGVVAQLDHTQLRELLLLLLAHVRLGSNVLLDEQEAVSACRQGCTQQHTQCKVAAAAAQPHTLTVPPSRACSAPGRPAAPPARPWRLRWRRHAAACSCWPRPACPPACTLTSC